MATDSLGITPIQQMASSCAGAFVVSLFMTPLDVVKIRLQAQDLFFQRKCFLYSNGLMDHLHFRVNGDPKLSLEDPVASHTREEICNCKWYNRPKYFNGTLDAMIKISKVEGVSSLWSGLSPTLVLAVPTTVIYFTAYEHIKKWLTKQNLFTHSDSNQRIGISLLSGGLARTWAVTVVSPLELVRTKMQSQKMQMWQVKDALRTTVKSEGVLALWKGYMPTLFRDVPFSALFWPSYEITKQLCHKTDLRRHKFGTDLVSGSAAGAFASAITLPMDVIKTRRQIELGETGLALGSKSVGTFAIAKEIVANRGVQGLFTGLAPRMLKVAPACAIMISSYEHCKAFFRDMNEKQDHQRIQHQTSKL